jgi:hypothetical protein
MDSAGLIVKPADSEPFIEFWNSVCRASKFALPVEGSAVTAFPLGVLGVGVMVGVGAVLGVVAGAVTCVDPSEYTVVSGNPVVPPPYVPSTVLPAGAGVLELPLLDELEE